MTGGNSVISLVVNATWCKMQDKLLPRLLVGHSNAIR